MPATPRRARPNWRTAASGPCVGSRRNCQPTAIGPSANATNRVICGKNFTPGRMSMTKLKLLSLVAAVRSRSRRHMPRRRTPNRRSRSDRTLAWRLTVRSPQWQAGTTRHEDLGRRNQRQGGLLGRPVKIIFNYDDQSNPPQFGHLLPSCSTSTRSTWCSATTAPTWSRPRCRS